MHRPSHMISIVTVRANEVMSETFLKKATDMCKSGVGIAVRETGKLNIEKFHELDPEKSFALLNKININTKKFERQFFFCSFPAEFDEDEIPPYAIIKDSRGNPILIVGCEGDLKVDNLANEDDFGEAFVLLHEYLGPKIEEMYKVLGNNPGSLFNYLKTDSFANDLKQVTGHRSVFSFMTSVGEPFLLGDPKDLGGKFSWGTASNNFGYTESATEAATPLTSAAAEPVPAPAKPKNASKYASGDDDDALMAPPPPKPETEPKPVLIPPAVTGPLKDPPELVSTKTVKTEEIDWVPAPGLHGKKLKAAYRAVNNGILPKKWHERPTLRITAKKTTSSTKEASQVAAAPLDSPAAAPKAAAAATSVPSTKLDVLTLPVITAKQQADGVAFIKKYLGDGSTVLDEHPLETQKAEAKLHKFSELVLKSGDLDEVWRWPTAGIFKFCADNSDLAALAIIEYRRDRYERKMTAVDGGKKLSELTGTSPEPAPLKKASGASKYE